MHTTLFDLMSETFPNNFPIKVLRIGIKTFPRK